MDDTSSNDDEEALGPTSCAPGPHPVEIQDAKHLCNSSFVSATIYAPKIGITENGKEEEKKNDMLLPSSVLMGGWGCGETVMAAWACFLASHGIVAMTIGAPKPFEDMPAARCRALLDAMKALQTENVRVGSALEGRLDISKRSLMGLSLGGGGAQLAALEDPDLRCVVAFVPHDGTGPPPAPPDAEPFPETLTSSVPTLIIAGEKDDIADPKLHAWPMYHKCSAPKLIMEVTGGDHALTNGPAGGSMNEGTMFQRFWNKCSLTFMVVSWFVCGVPFPAKGSMESQAREHSPKGAVGGVALSWLRLFLLGDESTRSKLVHKPSIASKFETSGL